MFKMLLRSTVYVNRSGLNRIVFGSSTWSAGQENIRATCINTKLQRENENKNKIIDTVMEMTLRSAGIQPS